MSAFIHTFPVRVYYEDTDHGGVVYHANYLKFMERGRTEFLRDTGIELNVLEADAGIRFAVSEIHLHYLHPARFNDLLHVDSTLIWIKGARLAFHQSIRRQRTILVEGEIRLACIRPNRRPCRIPEEIVRILKPKLAAEPPSGVKQ